VDKQAGHYDQNTCIVIH